MSLEDSEEGEVSTTAGSVEVVTNESNFLGPMERFDYESHSDDVVIRLEVERPGRVRTKRLNRQAEICTAEVGRVSAHY